MVALPGLVRVVTASVTREGRPPAARRHFRTFALACAIKRASRAATAARAHSWSEVEFMDSILWPHL